MYGQCEPSFRHDGDGGIRAGSHGLIEGLLDRGGLCAVQGGRVLCIHGGYEDESLFAGDLGEGEGLVSAEDEVRSDFPHDFFRGQFFLHPFFEDFIAVPVAALAAVR